jgi:hypothetical protein
MLCLPQEIRDFLFQCLPRRLRRKTWSWLAAWRRGLRVGLEQLSQQRPQDENNQNGDLAPIDIGQQRLEHFSTISLSGCDRIDLDHPTDRPMADHRPWTAPPPVSRPPHRVLPGTCG